MNEQLAPLPIGTQAPRFKLHRTENELFLLQDASSRPAVIVFYPGDWEPVSSSQLTLYQAYLPAFEGLGAALVAISVDSVWSHLAFARDCGLRFPLLADYQPKGAVARAYGVYRELEGSSARALFVVDGAGTIRWSHAYPMNLNPGVDGILTALEALCEEAPSKTLGAEPSLDTAPALVTTPTSRASIYTRTAQSVRRKLNHG